MRKLIVWIASAVTLISVSAARPALLGETSVVAPILTGLFQPAAGVSSPVHLLRHGQMPVFMS